MQKRIRIESVNYITIAHQLDDDRWRVVSADKDRMDESTCIVLTDEEMVAQCAHSAKFPSVKITHETV